ncbi:hypothetical protein OS187_03445 [Xanthomonadaceae bacterium JHOS43]|nr:hypothetical protein [Xanthomonadaceae bacterium JHOS43]MCX7563249.1 hypothetical protein [Xanthomonadaceae bacterium XH05]
MRPFMFSLQPPRHPLARLALGLAGLVLLGFFTVFGLVVAAALLAVFALRRLYLTLRGERPGSSRPVDPQVIDGEFTVVEKARLPR